MKKILMLIMLFAMISIVWINKGTFALNEEDLTNVILECPEEVLANSEFECNVYLNPESGTILSINANYDLPQDISYVSFAGNSNCTDENCFKEFASTKNGFAYGNVLGTTNKTLIGTLILKTSDSVELNSTHSIKLVNIELSDNNYKMIEVGDITRNVTISTTSNDNNITTNPKTGTTSTIIISIILVTSLIICIYQYNKKIKKKLI